MCCLKLISVLKEHFGFAETEFVISAVNSLENRIRRDMFIPAGIKHRKEPLNSDVDLRTRFILDENAFNMYFYYTAYLMAAEECDSEQTKLYKSLFEQTYSEISADFRRNYIPVVSHKIGGI